jgi:hypothetical protein
MDNAEASLITERNYQMGECLIGYSAPQLSVERIDGGLSKRVSVYLIDCFQKLG